MQGFAWIEDSLCRASWSSGDKLTDNYLLFLKANGITSVMNVSGFDFDDQTLKLLSENNISLVSSSLLLSLSCNSIELIPWFDYIV